MIVQELWVICIVIVTDDGHVRWVCQQHYDAIKFANEMTDYIRQLVTMGGIFYAETNKVSLNQLKLTNANVKMFLIC